jgi:hypothetical protein
MSLVFTHEHGVRKEVAEKCLSPPKRKSSITCCFLGVGVVLCIVLMRLLDPGIGRTVVY